VADFYMYVLSGVSVVVFPPSLIGGNLESQSPIGL